MAIKPPSWQKDAVPTLKGWIHPKTKEILVGGSIAQSQIDFYLNAGTISAPEPEVIQDVISDIEIDIEEDIDWEIEEIDLDSMTKLELIETAEEWKIKIDPKATKSKIKSVLEEELF